MAVFLLGTTLARAEPVSPESTWPGFRGHDMSGVVPATRLPERWSTTERVAWRAEIAGKGWSSPIVWDGVVYLTTAVGSGPFKAPSTGLYGNDYAAELSKQGHSDEEIMKRVRARDIEATDETSDLRYVVYALDVKTGKVKWQREAHRSKPFGGRHRKNTYASETPFTDGERLYVSFGQNVGLFCYSLDGTLLWKKQWDPQPIYLDFGTASSPTVADDRIYLLHDSETQSYITALDAKTGRELWRSERPAVGFPKSSWMTPFVWKNAKRTRRARHRHPARAGCALRERDLQGARGRRRQHVLRVADRGGLARVPAQRGGRHVRPGREREHVHGSGAQRARRDVARLAGGCGRRDLHPHGIEPVQDRPAAGALSGRTATRTWNRVRRLAPEGDIAISW